MTYKISARIPTSNHGVLIKINALTELSLKSKEQKIPKTNTSKCSRFTTPNRYEALKETDIPDSIEITEQTNDISSPTPSPIFITTSVDFNDFCKSILSIHRG